MEDYVQIYLHLLVPNKPIYIPNKYIDLLLYLLCPLYYFYLSVSLSPTP